MHRSNWVSISASLDRKGHRFVWDFLLTVTTAVFLLSTLLLFSEAAFVGQQTLLTPNLALTQFGLDQPKDSTKLGKGMFLIAARKLRDPNFRETVVLLLNYNQNGAMGLVLNRDTGILLLTLLTDTEALIGRQDTLFIGGPVARTQMFMLFRSEVDLDDANRIFDDVQVSSSRHLLDSIFDASKETELRVCAGYSGWGRGQLESEVASGAWHLVTAEAETVFERDTAQIWRKLIEARETRWATIDQLSDQTVQIKSPDAS